MINIYSYIFVLNLNLCLNKNKTVQELSKHIEMAAVLCEYHQVLKNYATYIKNQKTSLTKGKNDY